jgi:hypothetical protein
MNPVVPRPGRIGVAVAVAILVAATAACGKSSSSTTSTAGNSTTSTTAAGGSSSTTSTTSAANKGKAALSQVETKLQAGQTATFLGTYKVSGTTGGISTFTVAHSGTSSSFGIASQTGAFEEIETAASTVVCAQSSGKWQCFTGTTAQSIGASLNSFVNIYGSKAALEALKNYESSAVGASVSSKSVAGQAVTCVTFRYPAQNGSYTYCVTDQGVLAEWSAQSSAGHWALVLSSFTGNVPASQFTPPATPTTLPTGVG